MGVAGVIKPFARPIPAWWSNQLEYLSPISETAFHYLIPGLVGAAVCFAFISSLKVRELRPALHALVPRISMLLAAVAGATAGYLYLGETTADLIREYQPVVDELTNLAEAACADDLPNTLTVPLTPLPNVTRDGSSENILFVSCEALAEPLRTDLDPLHLGQLSLLIAQGVSHERWIHAGALPWVRERYEQASSARYLVMYRGASIDRQASLVDRETKNTMPIVSDLLVKDTLLFAALANATGGKFPKGEGVGAITIPRIPPKQTVAALPMTAEFEFHSSARISTGSLLIHGFVTNTSSIASNKPEVIAILKDKDGRELGSTSGYGAYALGAGQRAPVQILVPAPPSYESIGFETHVRRLGRIPIAQELVIASSNKDIGSSASNISGKVRNQGKEPARFVQVHILRFNKEDKLVRLQSVYAKAETLEPGQEARFLQSSFGSQAKYARMELQVTGQQGRR